MKLAKIDPSLTKPFKDKSKNWKFSKQDLAERKHWDKYMEVFQKMIDETDLAALKMRFPDAGRST